MSASVFEALCDGLTELFALEKQPIEYRSGGLQAFHFRVQDTDVHLLHAPPVDARTASLVIDCGAMDPADELQGWLYSPALAPAAFARFMRQPVRAVVLA